MVWLFFYLNYRRITNYLGKYCLLNLRYYIYFNIFVCWLLTWEKKRKYRFRYFASSMKLLPFGKRHKFYIRFKSRTLCAKSFKQFNIRILKKNLSFSSSKINPSSLKFIFNSVCSKFSSLNIFTCIQYNNSNLISSEKHFRNINHPSTPNLKIDVLNVFSYAFCYYFLIFNFSFSFSPNF